MIDKAGGMRNPVESEGWQTIGIEGTMNQGGTEESKGRGGFPGFRRMRWNKGSEDEGKSWGGAGELDGTSRRGWATRNKGAWILGGTRKTNNLEGPNQAGRNSRVGTRLVEWQTGQSEIPPMLFPRQTRQQARSGSRMEMVARSSSESNNSAASGSWFVAGFGFSSGSEVGTGVLEAERRLLGP